MTVRLFADFRRLTGAERFEVEVSEQATVGEVVEIVRAKYPVLENYKRSTLVAKGMEFSEPTEKVSEGEEISLMPPVMGG